MDELNSLVDLNDEIASWVRRRGWPVLGLAKDAAAVPDVLGRINASVARRMVHGDSLSTAIRATQAEMPRAYFAMLQVGLSCDDLPRAWRARQRLEEPLGELLRHLTRSLIYPAIVVVAAAVLLIITAFVLDPVIIRAVEAQELTEAGPLAGWSPVRIAALLFFLLVAVMTVKCHRAVTAGTIRRWNLWGWRAARQDVERALVASVTADLVAQELPPAESLALAIDLVEDADVRKELADTSAISVRGAGEETHAQRPPAPTLIRHLADHGHLYGDLVELWRLSSRVYQDRCLGRLDRLRRLAPMIAGVVVGGIGTLLYALSLFVPLAHLLQQLARS